MKKITLTLFLFLVFIYSGYSQVQVGSGSNIVQNFPFNNASYYTYSQSIYLASEINASGQITSIQWYYNGTSSMPNSQDLVIYMGTTSKSSFSSNSDWESVSNLTQVYSGGITTNSTPGWKTIQFDTPFTYDGISNLIVAVDENTPGNDSGATNKFWNTEVESIRSIAYYNNVTNPLPSSPPAAVITRSFVPDVIFGGLTQTCTTPYYFTFSNITDTSAIISWQASSYAPFGGSDYYFSTSNTRPSSETVPMGSVVSGTSADVSPLTPYTKYYVWVRNNCGNGEYSSWSEMSQFTSQCAKIPSFIENFDTTTVPDLPICWSKILRGPSISNFADVQTVSDATNAHSGLNSVSLNNSNSVDNYDIILVSPNLTSLVGPHRLKFYAKDAVDLEVGTLNSNLNDATFNVFEDITSTGTMTQYIVDFSSYHGSDTYVGIRLNASAQNQFLTLDDIQWEYIPLCDDVTGISVPSVTATSGTFNWLPGSSETSWDIAVGESTVTDPSTLSFDTATTNPTFTKIGLNENTSYKVWVRSICAAGTGSWIGPVYFQTDCASVDHFSESFDGVTTPKLPDCWSKILRGVALASNSDVKTIANNNYYSSLNSLLLSNTSSTGEFDIIAVSPNLSTLSTGNYRVRFFAKGAGALDIGTLDSNTNSATFTNVITLPTTSSYAEYVVEFKDVLTDTHVGIRLSTPTQQSNIYLDNIIFEPIPLCPDVTQVQVESKTDVTVTITWNYSTEQDWDIAVLPINITDPNGQPFDSTQNLGAFTKSGLSPNTKYQVWVRSVCGANKGSWIGQVPFTTNCATVESFSEDFQNAIYPDLPDCWTKILRGATLDTSAGGAYVITNNHDIMGTVPNWGELANKASTGNTYDVILVSPPVSTLTLGTYRLRFKAKKVSDGFNLQIGTLDDNSNTGNFSLLTTVELTTDYQEYKIYFDQFNGTTNQYIGLRLNSYNGYKTIKIDDIYWEREPSCADVDNITVPEVTTTSATVRWDVRGTEKKWDVAVGSDPTTDPNGLPFLTTTPDYNNSLEYPNLLPGTIYYVWVRANCGSGSTGAWIGPVRFTTDCVPVESFNEGFNVTPYPYIAPCWDQIVRNATAGSEVYNSLQYPLAGHSQPGNVTIFAANSGASADVIMVSPAVSTLNQAANYQLSFYGSGSNMLQVGTLNNKTINAVFTKVADVNVLGVNGSDNKSLHIVDMSKAKASDMYIGFKLSANSSSSQQYITLDDIVWQPTLGTGQFDLSQFNYFPNPVKDVLSISYANTINKVTVYNMLGQEVMENTVNHTEAKINMTELGNGPYLVKVALDDYVKIIKIIKE